MSDFFFRQYIETESEEERVKRILGNLGYMIFSEINFNDAGGSLVFINKDGQKIAITKQGIKRGISEDHIIQLIRDVESKHGKK